ncbi:SyrB-like regulator [Rhizobium rhizogenes]|uniref:SyrB-like regulator n=1 Tax=Rhizobium rhizogenes TaxID=359 RepID=UPI0015727461|nr:SyrB-like regulator [Rhizobium rhizogenes]NTF66222.1 SyrB-like regulator [Rhizobium rhizogenes]NTG97275.1 SyrB-like regulator [Rhizobium rhizogenes]
MASENDTDATSAVLAPTPAETPVVKKQRAPRRSKAEIEAAKSASSTTVTSQKVRKTRSPRVEATPAVVATADAAKIAKKTGAKGTRKIKAVSQVEASALVPVTAADEMADLIQLEEENKQLRKALAEKLRAENADLRKRLGV